MSLQFWLPLTKDPNRIVDITSFSKESAITLTADTDGWYKVADSTHTSSRWGIYYDFEVRPNTTYTMTVYFKSTTGVNAQVSIGSFVSNPSFPAIRDNNTTSTEKLATYTWTTTATDRIARIYLAMTNSTIVANNYVFFKEPKVCEQPRSQGAVTTKVMNNGATYTTAGKLGGAYYFNASAYFTESTYNWTDFNASAFSIACWYKEPSPVASGNSQMICIGTNSGWNNIRIGLLRRTSNGYPMFSVSDGSNNVNYSFTADSFPLDTWVHICCTYDNGTMKMYLNGELHKTYTTTIVPALNSSQHLGIGAASNGAEKLTGYLNDVRIYDNCLTSEEVHRIAQGLVLHYLLNDKYCESVTNLASTATGGWNNSGNCTRLFNDTSLDSSKPTPGSVISVKITTAGNCALTCGTTGANHPSKTLTFSIWCYLSGPQENNSIYIRSTKTDGNVGNLEYNGSVLPTTWPTNKWIRLEKTITTASDATTFYFCTYANVLGRYVALNGWQIEQNVHANPWTSPGTARAASAVEYDCSGFGNNGIRTGAFTWTSDTPKYQLSTYMPKAALITHPKPVFGGTDQEWSCAAWFKLDNISQTSQYLNNFNIGNMILASTTPLLYLNSGTNDYYMYGKKTINANEWTHIVFVFRNSDALRNVYINGELSNNYGPNKTSTPSGIQDVVTIGSNLTGYLSDYRIYATALSTSDVKSLYQNCAAIDVDGTIHGQIRS